MYKYRNFSYICINKNTTAMQKKLYREKQGRKLLGVCMGIANYFDLDPTLIRLIWIISIFFFGGGILAYLFAALVLPERPTEDIVK